jgi:hypothetical protein
MMAAHIEHAATIMSASICASSHDAAGRMLHAQMISCLSAS